MSYQKYREENALAREENVHVLDMRRIAVLPFVNYSSDQNDEYFAEGLTQELISKLALVKELKTIARASSMKYKGTAKGITEIGRELGCGVLVEGSVRKSGDKIRVTVEVVDANSEEQLWSSSYDKNLNDIFAIQDEIAMKVSESVPSCLFPERPVVSANPDTNSLAAYSCYLKAQKLLNENTKESLLQALEYFSKATEIDRNYARAYVGIGYCYSALGDKCVISRSEFLTGVKHAALKALEISDTVAEAHVLMSDLAWAEDDFQTEEREARIAVKLNPNLPETNSTLGRFFMTTGYPQSALKYLEVTHSLDPLSAECVRYLGLMLSFVGREEEALHLWRQNLELNPFEMRLGLAEYYLQKKELENAEREISEIEFLSPSDFDTLAFRGYIEAIKRDKEAIQKIIVKLENEYKGGSYIDRTVGYFAYLFGDMEGFFGSMKRAALDHILDPFRLRYSPIFEKAREDPRYPSLLKSCGLDPNLKELLNPRCSV
jgi:adenylate cyclase